MAAVLAGGLDAVLSHRSAAALHGILAPSPGPIHVTVPRKLRRRPGLAFHLSSLPPDEICRIDGIPVTGLCRTILDLSARSNADQIERALHEAEVKRLTDRVSLGELIARYPRRQGVARIRSVLAGRRLGSTVTRSELEQRFLAFVSERGLPRPETNALLTVRGERLEVDFLWRESGLVVELDGRAAHYTARAFERDRLRDRLLQAAGWRVMRVTWRQLHDDPDALARDLRALLARGSPGA